MKKLFLMLLIVVSCSLSAQTNRETGINSGFDFLKTSQVANTTSVFKQIKDREANKAGQSCVQTCLQQFRSCIATAQGSGEWWYCELTFEACMVDCGI